MFLPQKSECFCSRQNKTEKSSNLRWAFFVLSILQVGDMRELGITESFAVKHAVVNSAAEAAEMILRVDDILKATPR